MAAFWNSVWDHDSVGIAESMRDKDNVRHYLQDKWDDLEYAWEAIYGMVATYAMGHMTDIYRTSIYFPGSAS